MANLLKLLIVPLSIALCGAALADEGVAKRSLRSRAAAHQAVKALGPGVSVHWPASRVRPTVIRELSIKVSGDTAQQRAVTFVQRHPALFAGKGAAFQPLAIQSTHDITVVRLRQTHRGLPVMDAEAAVTLNNQGAVAALRSECAEVQLSSTTPKLSGPKAVALALARVRRTIRSDAPLPSGFKPQLAVLPGPKTRLVYRVMLPLAHDPLGRIHLVDAHDGSYQGYRRGIIREGHGHAGQGVRR